MRRKIKDISSIARSFAGGALITLICLFTFISTATSYAEEPAREKSGSQRPFRIGVSVDLVVVYASVFDKNNRFIAGLDQDSFRIYEDGVEQQISSFSQEDVSVSMGLILDLSGSMRGKMEQVKNAALTFIRAGNSEDQFFVIGFNDEVELLQDYTSDADELRDALENTIVAGKTHLYDAVYLGVQKAQSGARPKKAVVVITDGEDDTSFYKLNEVISSIRESDVQVFCVGFLTEAPSKNRISRWSNSKAKKVYDALVSISEETGGKAFFPQHLSEIHGITSEIARELRSQYSIGYSSSNQARDGSFRKIKVELAGKKSQETNIRYRKGYFASRQR